MWTRKELKDKAKVSFRANYWKSVFVALVLMVTIGGLSMYSSASSAASMATTSPAMIASSSSPDNVNVQIKDGKVVVDVDDEKGGKVHVNLDAEDAEDLADVIEDVSDSASIHGTHVIFGPAVALVGVSLLLFMLAVMAIALAFYAFVLSPLEVGAQRFFIRNLNQRSEVKELAFGYDNNYKETVKTIFLRWLFIFLWGLLLIIPGIYKAYEYRMIPYLLAEDPTMTKDRAFAESKRMMDGQKWNTFVLDLSFLGWNILSAMTLGILGVFYVGPYQAQTNAALYEKLRYGLPSPEQPLQAAPVAPVAPVAPAAPVSPATSPYNAAASSGMAPVAAASVATAPVATAPAAAATAPAATAPVATATAAATAQMQDVPVIVSESQPPIPPFAAVGAQPAVSFDATEQLASDTAQLAGDTAKQAGDTAQLPEETAQLPAAEEPASEETAQLPADATEQLPDGAENGAASDSPDA